MALTGASTPSLARVRSSPERRQSFVGRRVDHDAAPRPARALRVLYVAEAFGGGMFEITRMQAEGLARAGHHVAIAYGVRPETPTDPRAVVDSSVELIGLPWTDRSLGAQLRGQRWLRTVCKRWRPDVVHLMSSFAGLHGVFASKGIPTVYTPQAYSFTMSSEPAHKRWAYLVLESFVARRVNAVGACSLSEGAQARSLPGAGSVVVVPNGIEELNRPVPHRPIPRTGRPLVVAMGRPLPQRQPAACARILSAISDRAEVRWIGGSAAEGPGPRALAEAGIPLTGWMPRDQTLAALAESNFYLHWTAWDGLPLSVLEAMAMDVIVVASDIGPNREVLGPRQVCRTEADAANLLRRLIADPALREDFLFDQHERRRSYGADEMVRRWAEIYSSLQSSSASSQSAAPQPTEI